MGYQVPLNFFKTKEYHLRRTIPGVLCHLDDVLVLGQVCQDHIAHLQAVLEQLRTTGITLNLQQKCEFGKTILTFLGHVINQYDNSLDPLNTTAIKEMLPPKTVSELRRLMRMINQLGKFSLHTSEISAPLTKLLRRNYSVKTKTSNGDLLKKTCTNSYKPNQQKPLH